MRLSIPSCLVVALAMLATTSNAQVSEGNPARDEKPAREEKSEREERSATSFMRETQLEWSRSPRPVPGQGAVQEPPPVVLDEGAPQQWAILMKDKTLYRAMSRWAAQAKYQLIWQVDRDYPIESGVVFEGGFRGAVTEVMSTVALTDYPLQAIFNPAARVLRVVRFLDEGRR
jgi:hypothetical protein